MNSTGENRPDSLISITGSVRGAKSGRCPARVVQVDSIKRGDEAYSDQHEDRIEDIYFRPYRTETDICLARVATIPSGHVCLVKKFGRGGICEQSRRSAGAYRGGIWSRCCRSADS